MSKRIPNLFHNSFGCDPEVFLSRDVGKVRKRRAIVGSELIIPKAGIKIDTGRIVRDGIQVELQPSPASCRAHVSNYLQACFQALDWTVRERAATEGLEGLKVDFRQVVKLSRGDLMNLSPSSRQLGCTPSLNVYGRKAIEKDGTRYLLRSAAGHIHIGSEMFKATSYNKVVNFAPADPKRAVHILDVLVGNTAVLIDRDPLAVERRKVYGRAGEYRLPKHGLEYRTLSNFWLKNYKLMSLMFGMTKLAALVAGSHQSQAYYSTRNKHDYYREYIWDDLPEHLLMQRVDLKLIEKAINTNDFDLARSNYEVMVKPFLQLVSSDYGLGARILNAFDFFVDKVREAELAGNPDPLTVWFPEDPLQHWLTKPEGHNTGWESFLTEFVGSKLPTKHFTGIVLTPTSPPIETPVVGAYIIPDAGYTEIPL